MVDSRLLNGRLGVQRVAMGLKYGRPRVAMSPLRHQALHPAALEASDETPKCAWSQLICCLLGVMAAMSPKNLGRIGPPDCCQFSCHLTLPIRTRSR